MSTLNTAYFVMVIVGFIALMLTLAYGQIATGTVKDKVEKAD